MRNKAFTLIELLVVIAIVGILSSVIYTNITGLRDRAKITAGIRFDSSTLHSIGDQLVGEWTFDGGNAIDTSGFNNHGTVSGATFATTSGYNNKGAYLFNVETNIITIPSSETLKLTDKMTISAWVNIASTGSMKGVIVSKHFQNFDYTFKYDNSQLMIRLVSGSTSYYTIKRGALDLNTWYNVVATWDKTLNSGKGRIFVNGSEVSYSQQDALVDNVNTSAQPLYIGNDRASCPCVEFSGLIDDVRVYSSSLSSSDIQKLYAEGISSHSSLANK